MQPSTWKTEYKKVTPIDMCAYGGKYNLKAPKVYFTSMLQYEPEGRTGNGKCNNGQCGQGEVINGHFSHFGKLGRQPQDGPRGQGALREKNAYPVEWSTEILKSVMAHQTRDRRVVIDLFSGWQSLRKACEKLGLTYIGIDIMGDRNRFVRETTASICDCGENPEYSNMFCADTCASCKPSTTTVAVEFGADECRCESNCAPAGSDTAHGSHGFNCRRNYQRWDAARE